MGSADARVGERPTRDATRAEGKEVVVTTREAVARAGAGGEGEFARTAVVCIDPEVFSVRRELEML
jgi:hypothetical protein